MSFNYTVTEVTKHAVKVKFDDNREFIIPVRTWFDKDRIEADIRLRFDEEDLGTVDDIPLKVGETHTIETIQEQENAYKEQVQNTQNEKDNFTFGYRYMRRLSYPFVNDTVGALVKAVLTGDKTELEALNTIIEETKTKIPKDDKRYTNAEMVAAREVSPVKNHFQDSALRSGVVPIYMI
tara:strand:- start:26 stop:565 length:540 start_codon:yes stop_codon:yes gene_type:complete